MTIDHSGTPLRVLYVLPYVPSPIRVRPFQLIRHLAALGHKITVVALEDGLASAAARAELVSACAAVHIIPLSRTRSFLNTLASLPTSTPLWAAWCRSPEMEQMLRELAHPEEFDIAHVEHLRAAHFAPCLKRLPAVLDAVDCITDLRRQMVDQKGGSFQNRIVSWIEWRKLRVYEPLVYRQYRRLQITSEHDAHALRALDSRLPAIDVIPNGVDLDYFRPSDDLPDDNCLVFSGKMSYTANDDAARYLISAILPRIRSVRRNTRLTVVGSGPSKALLKAAARAGNIQVTGYVDDIRPHLRRAVVAVCPIRIGVGIQNKVLEAMALARPVICSSLAARSLGREAYDFCDFVGVAAASQDKPVKVEDDPDRFAAACTALLAKPEEARRQGKAARLYVENYHDWKSAALRFSDVYHTVRSDG